MKFLNQTVLKKFQGKICLLRVDLNIEKGESLRSSYRLQAVLPTIQSLLKNNISVIILSHRGRPKNKISIQNLNEEKIKKNLKINKDLSLKPFAKIISSQIKTPIYFFDIFSFLKIKKQILTSKKPFVFLLENLRFFKEEEENDSTLARFLSNLGDFYVNDAFAVSHRENASITKICKYLPSYGGFLMEKEIKNLNQVMKNYEHPFTVILGGAKIKDKLGILNYFQKKADYFLLGGGPANTLLKAKGVNVKKSLVDAEVADQIKSYLSQKKIILPVDFKIKNFQILDIGQKTLLQYQAIIQKSKTIIWNGPVGFFEKKGFEKGTFGIWEAILKNKKAKIIVVGGGETITSLALLVPTDYRRITANTSQHKSASNINANPRLFLSTGGGAMLEYLSGKKLPGIKALDMSKSKY